jgi:type II secretion system protein C
MKKVLEIPKSLWMWIANIVLLLILGYIIFDFIFGNDRGQSAIIYTNPKDNTTEINPNKNTKLTVNHKAILDRNIFGSSDLNSIEKIPDKENIATQTSVLKAQLRLLATIAGDEEVACAVIENVTTKIQDLYKTGDAIEGTYIERIERNRIVLFNGKEREVLSLHVADGVSTPLAQSTEAEVVSIISPTEREINKKAFLAKVGGMEAILKMAKITPNMVNGKERGLRIEGLHNSSMAKYVGFENGDIIQNINGQTVTNRRKLSEILRRARAHSSFDTQLLRGTEKKTLSFRIK